MSLLSGSLSPLPSLHAPRVAVLMVALMVSIMSGPARAQVSMYAEPKARQPGDLITVILSERTNAQRESGWENRSNAYVGTGGQFEGRENLEGRFALDARFDKEALSRNESVQSDLLRGTITALVVGTDSAGNLQVEGERKLSVNGEAHVMKIRGLVRPYDIRYDNSILSYEIANADIEYRRAGIGRRFIKPATLARAVVLAVAGAAIYFAVER